jgi:GNAT superfamily N-acetyltransferase
MVASLRAPRETPRARHALARAIRAHERRKLLDWLDDGLRRGERGRLEAEYPISLTARGLRGHRAVFAGGRPVAHAMLHVVEARAGEQSARLGLIGSVYTAPEQRGRGLARSCIEACAEAARARGCSHALLWSELTDYYGQLGFRPAGRERRIALSDAALARAIDGSAPGLELAPARAADFPALEALYAQKPVHVARAAGALAKLARAPEVTLCVARRDAAPLAYAACGRGDDLRGVVHEWAGDAEGVLACVSALRVQVGAALLLASAHAEPAAELLVAAGASVTHTALGLALALAESSAAVADWIYLWGFDSI